MNIPPLSTTKSSLEALLIQSGNELTEHHDLISIVEKHKGQNIQKRKGDLNEFKIPKKSKHN